VENHDGSPIDSRDNNFHPQFDAVSPDGGTSSTLAGQWPVAYNWTNITSWNWRRGEWCTLGFPNCKNLTGRLHSTIVGPTGLSDQSDEGFTRSDRRTNWLVRPRLRPTVCQTSRTDCSRTAHICQSNQCGLLANHNTAYAAAWLAVRLAGRSDQSDVVSTRFDSRIGSRTKSNMFDSSDHLSDWSDEAFTRYDRRTESRTDRLVWRSERVNTQ